MNSRIMKRSEIYKNISLYILDNIAINQYDKEDKAEDISNGKLKNIFDDVRTLGNYKSVAQKISSWEDEWETEITVSANFEICEPASKAEKEIFKDFAIINEDQSFACITSEKLREMVCSDNISRENLRIIEQIWTAIHSDPNKKNSFWNLLSETSTKKYILVSNHPLTDKKLQWNQFCYAYFLYVNTVALPMDGSLDYDKNLPFINNTGLPYVRNKEYSQYFDIYALMSESHYCEDVLSRYLNMYQILENMCYRRYLVELSPKDSSETIGRGFVRRAIAKFSKGLDSENKEIPNGINTIFTNLAGIFSGDFTKKERNFLNKEYGLGLQVTGSPLPDLNGKTIADIIYQIRNSIVHNKATELHFSFVNVDDYKDIIPMIKKIVSKMEKAIAEKINTCEPNHKLEFKTDTVRLYC